MTCLKLSTRLLKIYKTQPSLQAILRARHMSLFQSDWSCCGVNRRDRLRALFQPFLDVLQTRLIGRLRSQKLYFYQFM